eukprot:TRINITY_DN77962_c0_g1_i1.p1 TRINITY_DN77962_c0_g1~~TRINITY_DN77962_c0_g1_i1.p1  ORF type:complete len:383 (+),score=58.91 TRINITY_DN77962_c0_g1_i1:102-1250(+)
MGISVPKGHMAHEKIDVEVSKRFKFGARIGRGCYGIVYSAQAINKRNGTLERSVAIKKIMSCFSKSIDAQRAYREVLFLMEFRNHSNIVTLDEVLCSHDDRHLYLVTELMDSDLQKALRVKSLQKIHRVYITYQILRALKYIHSSNIMHRDVKPANVLLNKFCDAKLADFGWAREAPYPGSGEVMTDYAATRWYRCPEMLFGSSIYTLSVDMWSIGTVAGEMLCEEPLIPGTSTLSMIDKIVELRGKPCAADIVALQAARAKLFMQPIDPGPPYRGIEVRLPSEITETHDFLNLLLQWNPMKRMTAAEALAHPHVASFHNPDDEPVFGRKISLELLDSKKYSSSRYRDHIYADAIGLPSAKRIVETHRKANLESQVEGDDVI